MKLEGKCLALTGTFETGKLAPECFSATAGNFDGQGMSFGALQWNLGQETLQPILKKIFQTDPGLMKTIFGDYLDMLILAIDGSREDAINFGNKISGYKGRMSPLWTKMFAELGKTDLCQSEQIKAAKSYFGRAISLAKRFDIQNQRGVALMFDCCVQNGGVRKPGSKELAVALDGFKDDDTGRMMVLANWVAGYANKKWKQDVLARKMCIAVGGGEVHKKTYNLEKDFGITMENI